MYLTLHGHLHAFQFTQKWTAQLRKINGVQNLSQVRKIDYIDIYCQRFRITGVQSCSRKWMAPWSWQIKRCQRVPEADRWLLKTCLPRVKPGKVIKQIGLNRIRAGLGFGVPSYRLSYCLVTRKTSSTSIVSDESLYRLCPGTLFHSSAFTIFSCSPLFFSFFPLQRFELFWVQNPQYNAL